MSALEIQEKQVNGLVVTKKIASQQLLLRELVGGALFDLSQGGNLGVGTEQGQIVTKKVAGIPLSEIFKKLNEQQKKKILKKLAKLLLEVKKTHEESGSKLVNEVIDLLGFGSLLSKNIEFLEVTTVLNDDQKEILLRDLLSLRKILNKDLTLVHGDLNLGNILLVGNKLVLIDFEHVCEGPIELEIATSQFWQDDLSLPVRALITALKEVGMSVSQLKLECSLSLFLVNQLRLATDEMDQKKITLLKKIALSRGIIN